MQTVIRDEVVYSTYTAIADDRGNAITYRELAQKADGLKEYIEKRSLLFFYVIIRWKLWSSYMRSCI